MTRFIRLAILSVIMMLPAIAIAETLRVAVGEWEPYIGENKDGYGITSKDFKKIAEHAGYEVDFVFMRWKEAYNEVKEGVSDVSLGWMRTDKRLTEVLYSEEPLLKTQKIVLYNKNIYHEGAKVSAIEQLKGRNVIAVRSYWYIDEMLKHGIDPLYVDSDEIGLRLVARGRADAIILTKAVAISLISSGNIPYLHNIGFADRAITENPMYPIFPKHKAGVDELIKKLDESTRVLLESDEIKY